MGLRDGADYLMCRTNDHSRGAPYAWEAEDVRARISRSQRRIDELYRNGVVYSPARSTIALTGVERGPQWDEFSGAWDGLPLDQYMSDGGRYRGRRFGVYEASPDGVRRLSHQPHYQSRKYNALHGGLQRWYAPITVQVDDGPILRSLIEAGLAICKGLGSAEASPRLWRIEVHQFRIEAVVGHPGEPTPEGMHRDGVAFVMTLLIARSNVRGGVVSDLHRTALAEVSLKQPLDCLLLDDRRVMHAVTPIEPEDPNRPAYRDVLVLTYQRRPDVLLEPGSEPTH